MVFCPNLNATMWYKAAVQRNVETLRGDGHVVVDPELTMAYEVDSGALRESWVIPEAEQLIERLQQIHQRPEFSTPHSR